MSAEEISWVAADAAALLQRAASDLDRAVTVIRLARSVAQWESPAGDLAREQLRQHETRVAGMEDESVWAAQTIRAAAASGAW